MANFLNRSHFLQESAGLFTDQRIAIARTKIMELFDCAALGNTSVKCESIAKMQEIVLNTQIELLEEFLDSILCFCFDKAQEVRKAVVSFIEQICKLKINLLPRLVNALANLLRDSCLQVTKRVIQAFASIYKNSLQWISSNSEISEDVENAWSTVCIMKAEILDMIDHDNDGVRTNAVKFLEGVVVLQTYADEDSMKREKDFSLEDVPVNLKIVKRRKLEIEALNIFECLLQFHAAAHISSVNLIACTGSLCTIAKLRTSLMGPVITALRNLNYNLPPTLTDSQVSSVRKHLKMQLLNFLKSRGSSEMYDTIVAILQNLGLTPQEISRVTTKTNKLDHKRGLSSNSPITNKRLKYGLSSVNTSSQSQSSLDELDLHTNKIDEKHICEYLNDVERVVEIVMTWLEALPIEIPNYFLLNYNPIGNMTVSEQIAIIASFLWENSGISCSSNENVNTRLDFENLRSSKTAIKSYQVELIEREVISSTKKDEATKKLRNTMEKSKGENALIQRMKLRVKTLKLQEITKPLSRQTKEQYMLEAVFRILKVEQQSINGGVSARRRKILTVMAATFPDNIREKIFAFITMDLKNRIGLAFSWLFEEYCLLQGFTRHSYVKTEHKPDFAYNQLINQLIKEITTKPEFKEKIILLRRVFLEAPFLTDEAINYLINTCKMEDISHHGFELLKDVLVRRPPSRQKLLQVFFQYAVHENILIRERSIENIITLYTTHDSLKERIGKFAVEWLTFLDSENPPPEIFHALYGRPEVIGEWNDELVKPCLTLTFALLPYKSELINQIGEVYTKTSASIKRTILRTIESPIQKIDINNVAILKFIEKCPKGVETLVTRIVHTLTEKKKPTPELVLHIRELYKNKVTDVRILIPVLAGLTKNEILAILPKIIKLNPVVIKEVFNRLFGIGIDRSNHVAQIIAEEVLISLHTIENSACEIKYIVKAISLCLAEKVIFTQDILASCLQQLVEITPAPMLLMRTIIQSLTLYPRLASLIINLLQRLISKKIWQQKIVWDGFLKCCQKLKPHSFPVLLQLAPLQLQDALLQCPDIRIPLLEYAETIRRTKSMHISSHMMDTLSGDTQDILITDESGGYVRIENIKKEKEDVEPKHFVNSQPLPPGEE